MEIISRKEAKAKGLKRYFTGNPCPKGHVAERYTKKGSCCECLRMKSISGEKKIYDQYYYQKNKSRILDRSAKYHLKNRERNLARVATWQSENKSKVKSIKQSYKHRRRCLEEGGISSKDLMNWKNSQEKICFWCDGQCEDDYHVDHIYPLSKGGKHDQINLCISCPSCNVKKNAKDPYEFLEEILK